MHFPARDGADVGEGLHASRKEGELHRCVSGERTKSMEVSTSLRMRVLKTIILGRGQRGGAEDEGGKGGGGHDHGREAEEQ